MPNRKKSIHLEEIAAGRAQHGADFRLWRGGERQGGRGSCVQHARLSLEKARSDVGRLCSYMTSGPGDGKRENGRRRGAGLGEGP